MRRLVVSAAFALLISVSPGVAHAAGLQQLPAPNSCLQSTAGESSTNCTIKPFGLGDAREMAMTPDGSFAYVTSSLASTVTAYSRDSTGALHQLPGAAGCVRGTAYRDAFGGEFADCATTSVPGLNGALGAAVSPDGNNLYVASIDDDALVSFSINQSTGALTPLGGAGASCIKSPVSPAACTRTQMGLHGLRWVTVSPDGHNVYTASSASDAINIFTRKSDGTLTPNATVPCIQDTLAPSDITCPRSGPGLNYPREITVSPDGKNVYVSSDDADRSVSGDPGDGDAVSAFSRDALTGALTQLPGASACLEDPRAPASTKCPTVAKGLLGAFGVTVSPDGAHVYVASEGGDAISILQRDGTTGALSQPATGPVCVMDVNNHGEGCPTTAPGLDGAETIRLSADGRRAYVASFGGSAVAQLVRDPATGGLASLPGDAACLMQANSPSKPKTTQCPTNVQALTGPRDVRISPDGKFAYVPSSVGDTVSEFSVDPTAPLVPSATTGAAVAGSTAGTETLSGTVNPLGTATSYHFEYGPTTSYGTSTASQSVGSGVADTAASAALTGLKAGVVYHYRLVATSAGGTAAGADRTFSTPAGPGSPYDAFVRGDGAAGYWRLDETTGATAADTMGASPGTYSSTGITRGVAGAVAGDSAVSFNGTTGLITINDTAALHVGDTFTLEAWVKPAKLGAAEGILQKGAGYMFFLDAANRPELYVPNVGPVVLGRTGTGIKDTTKWHHVAVTKSGTALHLYVDGVDVTGTVTNRRISDNTSPLLIGAGASRFNGGIDEVAIYPTALSATAIDAHYQAAGNGGSTGGGTAPTATTGSATQVTATGATLGGSVNPQGTATTFQFQYGTDTTYASGSTTTQSAGSGTTDQAVSAAVGGLQSGTTYHFRITASSTAGSATGADATFTTPQSPPPLGNYAATVQADGPVSYWRLGELSGTRANDAMNANPGTYSGGVTLGAPGAVSGDTAAIFDGSTGLVSVGDSASLHTGDTFSLEAWIKPVKLGSTQGIVAKGGSYMFFIDAGGRPELYLPNVGPVAVAKTAVPDTTAWHYVAVTKAGSSVHLYLDGQEVPATVTNLTLPNGTSPLVIAAGAARFRGGIDEVALYRTALTPTQVSNHFMAAG